jgi:NADPH-dependent ferric siderophore reductase
MTDTHDVTDGHDGPAAAERLDSISALMDEIGEDVLYQLNVDFEDSIALVGRVLGGRPTATATKAIAIDRAGVDVIITDPDGDHPGRIEFAEPVDDVELLTTALLELVSRASEEAGERGDTSASRQLAEVTKIRTFLTEVVAVADINPHLRQVTFRGGDLTTFVPAGPDTFLYLLLPPPGRTELGIDQSFTWEAHARMEEADQPVGAYYTLRRWRPEVAELDILMVLHGDAGPASAWAGRAQPGDQVALWGPRTAYHPPEGTDRFLLVADETGLPAVAVILEHLPEGATAQVVAEVDSHAERHELRESPAIDVIWVHRDGAEAGTTTLLADAVRALPPPTGTPYVWGGGESRALTAVRRHVRDVWGLDREAVSLVAYWRHHDSPPVDSDD